MNTSNFEDLAGKIAGLTELRELEIYELLEWLSAKKTRLTRNLIRKTGLPKQTVYKILKEFREFLEPQSRVLAVKAEFREEILRLATKKVEEIKCVDREKVKSLIIEGSSMRPTPNRDYDQFFATKATSVKRAVLMARNGDLWGRSVAILGDDDLNSVAIAAAGQAKRICVFEIDERLVKTVINLSGKYDLRIEVVRHDLRRPIGKEYLGQFDTIFTDPPYTPEGFGLFINRGIELLRKKNTSRIYACYGNSERARERDVEIQKGLAERGLAIRFKKHRFNRYQGAESIGSQSSLYGLDWTPKTRTVNLDIKKFYTNE